MSVHVTWINIQVETKSQIYSHCLNKTSTQADLICFYRLVGSQDLHATPPLHPPTHIFGLKVNTTYNIKFNKNVFHGIQCHLRGTCSVISLFKIKNCQISMKTSLQKFSVEKIDTLLEESIAVSSTMFL